MPTKLSLGMTERAWRALRYSCNEALSPPLPDRFDKLSANGGAAYRARLRVDREPESVSNLDACARYVP
jgi:hypothetical protein